MAPEPLPTPSSAAGQESIFPCSPCPLGLWVPSQQQASPGLADDMELLIGSLDSSAKRWMEPVREMQIDYQGPEEERPVAPGPDKTTVLWIGLCDEDWPLSV